MHPPPAIFNDIFNEYQYAFSIISNLFGDNATYALRCVNTKCDFNPICCRPTKFHPMFDVAVDGNTFRTMRTQII